MNRIENAFGILYLVPDDSPFIKLFWKQNCCRPSFEVFEPSG
jgi:hypothetical protein